MAIDQSPATVANSALSAIPFSSLIGAPLNASIEAQAQAAQTSWQFIEQVGLNTDPNTGEKKAVTVSFQYNKNGKLVTLNVPILTIVPIPFLSIDKVLIEFIANISASSSSVTEQSSDESTDAGGKITGTIGWGPFSVSLEANANYSSKQHSRSSQDSRYSVEYTMNVRVEGGQSDMPAGLGTVLNILQQSFNEVPDGGVTVTPLAVVLVGHAKQAGSQATVRLDALTPDGLLSKGEVFTFDLTSPTGAALSVTLNTDNKISGASTGQAVTNSNGVIVFNIETTTVSSKPAGSGSLVITNSNKDQVANIVINTDGLVMD